MSAGYPRVAGHDGEGARLDRGLERRQVAPPQVVQPALDGGDGLVGVGAGAAVPGEVLGARGHARALQADHRGGGVRDTRLVSAPKDQGADGDSMTMAVPFASTRLAVLSPRQYPGVFSIQSPEPQIWRLSSQPAASTSAG